MTPPKDRSGSRRSEDSATFSVVCHKNLIEAARKKAKTDKVVLSEVIRDFMAEWAGYEGPKVAGRRDRV